MCALFQFLMVRLKAKSIQHAQPHCSEVSIPYGTIKSGMRVPIALSASWFQFLMVRLKASSAETNILLSSKFQFLMVRLKEYLNAVSPHALNVSIPYGTIKSSITC